MIAAAKNMLFITKPQADHLSYGSKSLISHWSICEVDSKVKLFFCIHYHFKIKQLGHFED